jgi:Secretion system C-terminal sorting domain
MKKNLILACLTSVCLFFLTVTNAQGFYDDDFSSAPIGRLALVTGTSAGYNGWDFNSSNCAQGGFCNISCNWNTITATALTSPVPAYISSSKSILLAAGIEGPGRCLNTPFVPNLTTGDVVYMGVLVNFTSCPDNTGTAKGDFIRLISAPFNAFSRIGANGGGGLLKFRVGADGNASPAETAAGTPYSFNTTYFLVLKYSFNPGAADQSRLYVNPPSTAEPVAAEAVVNSSGVNADPTVFKGIQLNTLNAVTTSGVPSGNIGGIRISRTWAGLFGPIPVEMTSFDANAKGNTNVLNWKTATEINVSHFDIERSTDGIGNWTKIGQSKAAGNSVALNAYNFVDEKPFAVSYYRLKTNDLDGKLSYSKIVSVKQNIGKGTFKIFPQPVGDIATIQLESATSATTTISVLDASGRLVLSKNAQITEGSNSLNISTQNLASGLYLIRLDNGLTTITERFIKR